MAATANHSVTVCHCDHSLLFFRTLTDTYFRVCLAINWLEWLAAGSRNLKVRDV